MAPYISPEELDRQVREEAERNKLQFLGSRKVNGISEPRKDDGRVWKTVGPFLVGALLAIIPLLTLQLMNYVPRSEMQAQFQQEQEFREAQIKATSELTVKVQGLTDQVKELKEQIARATARH